MLYGGLFQLLFPFLQIEVKVLSGAEEFSGGKNRVFGLLGFLGDDFFGHGFLFVLFGVGGSWGIFIIFILFEFPSDIDEDFRFSFKEVGMREDIFGGFFSGLVEAVHIELR